MSLSRAETHAARAGAAASYSSLWPSPDRRTRHRGAISAISWMRPGLSRTVGQSLSAHLAPTTRTSASYSVMVSLPVSARGVGLASGGRLGEHATAKVTGLINERRAPNRDIALLGACAA